MELGGPTQAPFQFSLHVLDTFDAAPRHFEYLATQPNDQRPELTGGLRAIVPKGTIVTYNMTFKKRVLNEPADSYPEHEE